MSAPDDTPPATAPVLYGRPPEPVARPPRPLRRALAIAVAAIAILVLSLGCCGWAAYATGILERIGIVPSAADRLLAGTPDTKAAEAILADFEQAGLSTEGVSLMVMPIAGTDGQLAYARFDASKGFTFSGTADDDPMKPYLVVLSQGEGAKNARVRRVSIGFRNAVGEHLMTMTASSDAIARYDRGEIDEQEFFTLLDVKSNPSDLTAEAMF